MLEILTVLAIIIVAVAVIMVILAVALSKHTFKCKKCGFETHFKWHKLLFVTHFENEYRLTCSECGEKNMIAK